MTPLKVFIVHLLLVTLNQSHSQSPQSAFQCKAGNENDTPKVCIVDETGCSLCLVIVLTSAMDCV